MQSSTPTPLSIEWAYKLIAKMLPTAVGLMAFICLVGIIAFGAFVAVGSAVN